jgi:hypothetical protein
MSFVPSTGRPRFKALAVSSNRLGSVTSLCRIPSRLHTSKFTLSDGWLLETPPNLQGGDQNAKDDGLILSSALITVWSIQTPTAEAHRHSRKASREPVLVNGQGSNSTNEPSRESEPAACAIFFPAHANQKQRQASPISDRSASVLIAERHRRLFAARDALLPFCHHGADVTVSPPTRCRKSPVGYRARRKN